MHPTQSIDAIVDLFITRGYDGHFLSSMVTPYKIKDILLAYQQQPPVDINGKTQPLWLHGYLQWHDDDRPRISCDIWLSKKQEQWIITRMEIERKDRYAQLLQKSQLTNLPLQSLPTVREAIGMVNEESKKNFLSRRRGLYI